MNLEIDNSTKYFLNEVFIEKLIVSVINFLELKIFSLQVSFVDSETITEINNNVLNHNFSTDIITLNYTGDSDLIDAVLFISLDDCLENSILFNVKFENELSRLIIHGILHLLGLNDLNEDEKNNMRNRENELISKFENIVSKIEIMYDK